MSEKIKVEIKDQIATIKIHRPEAFNAFDLDTISVFAEQITSLSTNKSVRGVVVTGEGKAFCAGGDLKWAMGYAEGSVAAFHALAGRFHLVVTEVRRMPKPVIAAINGAAAGAGFSFALACDFRIMAKSAFMRQAYTSSGLCIDGGGSFTLPRLVGVAKAMEVAAFDKPISSEQALQWGLVTSVVEDGKALDAAIEMANELANKSLNSFWWSKKLINDSFDTSLETQLEHEREGLCACAEHPDGKTGLKAFVEKRKPVFK